MERLSERLQTLFGVWSVEMEVLYIAIGPMWKF